MWRAATESARSASAASLLGDPRRCAARCCPFQPQFFGARRCSWCIPTSPTLSRSTRWRCADRAGRLATMKASTFQQSACSFPRTTNRPSYARSSTMHLRLTTRQTSSRFSSYLTPARMAPTRQSRSSRADILVSDSYGRMNVAESRQVSTTASRRQPATSSCSQTQMQCTTPMQCVI